MTNCLSRLELMEAAGCSLLACTLAWGPDSSMGTGPPDIHAAADAVRAALHSAALPAASAAPAVKVMNFLLLYHKFLNPETLMQQVN